MEDRDDIEDGYSTRSYHVTKKMVVKNVEEDPVQMASWGVATTQVNSYNISKLKETIDQYKDRMAQMK